MRTLAITTVFFDLGATLGSPILSPPPVHLIGFDVFEFARPVLDDLRGRGLRLGVISNTGDDDGTAVDAVLGQANIRDFFEPSLRIYSRDVGLKKDSPRIFRLAAARAAVPPDQCLFVGEDAAERAFARQAGYLTAPHPLVVADVLDGQPLQHVRITVPREQASSDWQTVLRRLRVATVNVSGSDPPVVEAIAAQRALAGLQSLHFGVELLGQVQLGSGTPA
jgi:beta-phosphoglucomutase-like phosphatase (HAD superfamily)